MTKYRVFGSGQEVEGIEAAIDAGVESLRSVMLDILLRDKVLFIRVNNEPRVATGPVAEILETNHFEAGIKESQKSLAEHFNGNPLGDDYKLVVEP